MHRRILISLAVFSVLTAQLRVGEWKSYTSFLSPTSVKWIDPDNIFASTGGGILRFDTRADQFEFLNNDDGLDYSDIRSMTVTEDGLFYFGGNPPKGNIQVFSLQSGLLKNIDNLGLDQIGKIVIDGDRLYAVYSAGSTTGLLELSMQYPENPHFEEIYHDFPSVISYISDIDTDEEFVYLTTDGGVFKGEKSDILNFQSSWNIIYSGSDAQQLVIAANSWYLFNDQGINKWVDGNWNLLVSMNIGTVLDAHSEPNTARISFITPALYREFSIESENIQYSYQTPAFTRITCYDKESERVALGMKNRGLLILYPETGETMSRVPNTPVCNRFHSIAVGPGGEVIAHVNDPAGVENSERLSGIMIIKDGRFSHILSEMNTNGMYLDDPDPDNFTAVRRDWVIGGLGSGGIVWSEDGKIIFGVSGVFPSNPERNGGVIILDPITLEYSVIDTADGILDGMNGIVDNNTGTGYMSVHRIKKDNSGNIWVVNAYSEKYNHPAAIRTPDGNWYHVTAPDEQSYLPQSITFDSRNRTWFGFRDYLEFSAGGIKVVNTRTTLADESDDIWYPVSFSEEPPGTSVWDLTFDEMGLLWILTGGGVQGYQVFEHSSSIQLSPVFPVDYFSYIPFRMGDRILNDRMSNKWITSQSNGVRVITESTSIWPDDAGFTSENSPLLSNVVYDAAIDNENGIIYFATDKGISALKIYYDQSLNFGKPRLSVTPNPFNPAGGEPLIINGCPPGADVLILTLSGHVIAKVTAQYEGITSTQALWDGKQKNGNLAASGIYLITANLKDGTTAVAKVAVVRQ